MKYKIILTLLSLSLLFSSAIWAADPLYVATIPLNCDEVPKHLKGVRTPEGFKVSIFDAHKIAMKTSNIIKPCLSKLEQVIYADKKYYYFTNSVLMYKKSSFPKKAVVVDGRTGKAESTF